jgi:hypothetical protein
MIIMPSVSCGNIRLEDRFKCPYDSKNLQCKRIDWWMCRDYQNGNHSEASVIDDTGVSR